jgi:hypothetical protein
VVLNLMKALREELTRSKTEEAFIRETLRASLAQGYARVAMVCGAWHVPVLRPELLKKQDKASLKGLKKVPTETTGFRRLTSDCRSVRATGGECCRRYRRVAEQLASLDIPSFACAPTWFPEVMAAAIQGQKWQLNNRHLCLHNGLERVSGTCRLAFDKLLVFMRRDDSV